MTSRLAARTAVFPLVVLLAIFAGACHKKQPPVARPLPPPPPAPTVESKPPAPQPTARPAVPAPAGTPDTMPVEVREVMSRAAEDCGD